MKPDPRAHAAAAATIAGPNQDIRRREPSWGRLADSTGRRRGLPRDLLEDASRRLAFISIVTAAVYLIAFLMDNLVGPEIGIRANELGTTGTDLIGLVVIGLSLLMYAYARRCDCNSARTLDVGLVYEVLIAFLIGVANHWVPKDLQKLTGLSWICVWVLLFPMVVPSTPRRTLFAALASASMDPVGALIAEARGLPPPSASLLFWAYLPNYICACLAVLPSHIITRLGRQVTRAREMGSYVLEERLGRGGMGEVWRARHRMLVRPAAIKLIRSEAFGSLDSAESRRLAERFEREAQATATLQSPHTVQLYDFGITEEGTFYYVMELLDGLDLQSFVRRFGPVGAERTIHILHQACHSLSDAHSQALVHRDIKPANLFLCRMGQEHDFVKILDFGLVKVQRPQSPQETLATGSGAHLPTGTPAYMAPEIALGERTVDGRADLYALGCVGYWLMTGQLVFEGESPLAMLVQHIRSKPIPPSQRTEIEVPLSLETLILDCLEKDPARRPQSAEELARRLDACEGSGAWTDERSRRWWETNLPRARPMRSHEEEASPILLTRRDLIRS